HCPVRAVRRQSAGDDLPRPRRPRSGLPRRSRLYHAARRQDRRLRRAPPSPDDYLRSRGRRHHAGKPHSTHLRSPEGALISSPFALRKGGGARPRTKRPFAERKATIPMVALCPAGRTAILACVGSRDGPILLTRSSRTMRQVLFFIPIKD